MAAGPRVEDRVLGDRGRGEFVGPPALVRGFEVHEGCCDGLTDRVLAIDRRQVPELNARVDLNGGQETEKGSVYGAA